MFAGHSGWVSDATFSPDGTRLTTVGGGDATARIWDAASGVELLAIPGWHAEWLSADELGVNPTGNTHHLASSRPVNRAFLGKSAKP